MNKKRGISKKKPSKSYLALCMVSLGIIGIVTLVVMKAKMELARSAVEPPNPMRTKGKLDAPIKIIEYADLQCEPCATGAQSLNKYMKDHPDTIFLEFKHFPLDDHKHSLRAAIFSECAGRQGKFWPFVDKVFEQQDKWNGLMNIDPFFEQLAYDLGINKPEFSQCIGDPQIKKTILKQKEHGELLEIDTVPTYYINKEMLAGDEGLIQKIKDKSGAI